MTKEEVIKYLDKNMPDIGIITEDTIKCAQEYSTKYRGSVRISNGLVITNEEYEREREEVLNTPLP